jgi:hypothetical protein
MRFERGKDPKESLELGMMAKVKKYAPDVLAMYQFELVNEETLEQIKAHLEKVLGFPVEVVSETVDDSPAITIKIK